MSKIDTLNCYASLNKPDLILLTETWCHDNISDAYLAIDGYDLISDLRKDRADTALGRGGGLLVYVKNGITVFTSDSSVNFHQYCIFKLSDITFYLVYKSPNAPATAIDGLAELIRGAPKHSIFIGDFNLPEVDWSTCAATGRAAPLLEAAQDKFYSQLVDFPTQVSGNILDLLLTDIPERIVDLTAGDRLGASDHVMLNATISLQTTSKPVKRTVLNWSKADFTGMGTQLDTICWDEIFRDCTANEMWEVFRDHLQAAVDKFVPAKQASPLGRPPWMTREIAAAIRRKRKLWKETRHLGRTEEYLKADREVRRLIRRSKRGYEKRLAEGGEDNRRPFYSYVKRKTRSRPSVGPLMDKDNNRVTSDKDMADLLNSFFSSVFTTVGDKPVPQAAPMVTERISDLKVTASMVEKAIDKLRPSAAPGPDKIGPQLLQKLKKTVSPVLAKIFNASLDSGQVPDDWRKANVTPIFKKGSKADPGNYRPVSLTSVCCKLLERLIKDSLVEHLLKNNLILPSQHGFMPNKSCTTNLLEFFEIVTEAVDEGSPFDIIFLDFAKAFDKVPVAPLLAKLQALGVEGQLLCWIKEWLSNRRQRVVLNGQASDWADVTSGVPQGSILGPLLFVIYINDIDLVIDMIELLKKFADDTKLGQRVATAEQRSKMQEALDNVVKWADTWGMKFNVKKCKVMHVGHNNPRQQYQMEGQLLEKGMWE